MRKKLFRLLEKFILWIQNRHVQVTVEVRNKTEIIDAFNKSLNECSICVIAVDNILRYGGFNNFYKFKGKRYGPESLRWHLEGCMGIVVEINYKEESGD